MANGLKQAMVVLLASGVGGCLTVALARRQLLTFRLAMGWLIISLLAAVSASAARLVTPLSSLLGMTPTGFIFGVASGVLLAVSLQLSVSISRLRNQIRDMAQAIAIREAEASNG